MRICSSLAVLTVVLATAACSSNEAAKPAYCEKPPDLLVAKILAGTDLTAVDAVAVAAQDVSQGTYVAIRFNKPTGRRSEVGVWAARGDRAAPSAIFAINPTAEIFTEWPLNSDRGAIEYAELVKGCLS